MIFDEELHLYSENGIIFTSVNEFLDNFQKPFAKVPISRAVAKKQEREVDDVLSQWDKKRVISTNYGNSVHDTVEYWNRWGLLPDQTHLMKVIDSMKIVYNGRRFISEQKVVSRKLGIAGTIDILEPLGNKVVNIADIKTNDIYKKSKGKLLAPFSGYSASKIMIYSLQLSLYAELLERMGLTVERLDILHWTEDKFDVVPVERFDFTEAFKMKGLITS